LLDGRNPSVAGYTDGNFVGPTILEATTEMDCYKEEIFGPVLVIVKSDSLDDAIALINRNHCASCPLRRVCRTTDQLLSLIRRQRHGHLYPVGRDRPQV
jgi:acyl-CoA reductase-like NAD-dependent aldehyde dehydrogenase